MVSGLPTDGGFAGYLSAGTITIATKPIAARAAESARGLATRMRLYAIAKTRPKMPPSAVPYVSAPVSSPQLRCVVRLTTSYRLGCFALCLIHRALKNAMARSTCGSPINRANAKTSRPATSPASIPRISRIRVIGLFSGRENRRRCRPSCTNSCTIVPWNRAVAPCSAPTK